MRVEYADADERADGAEHYGEELAETAEAPAELIIAEELKLQRGRFLILIHESAEATVQSRPAS